jgi:hypothetical protein
MSGRNRGSESQDPSIDTCLKLLANRQRRRIFAVFLDSGTDYVSVDELVAAVVGNDGESVGSETDHDTVVITLFHVHLPKFDDAGVVEYDARNRDVRYRGDPKLEAMFETIQNFE